MPIFQIPPFLKYKFNFNKMYSVWKKKRLQGVMKKVECMFGIYLKPEVHSHTRTDINVFTAGLTDFFNEMFSANI